MLRNTGRSRMGTVALPTGRDECVVALTEGAVTALLHWQTTFRSPTYARQ